MINLKDRLAVIYNPTICSIVQFFHEKRSMFKAFNADEIVNREEPFEPKAFKAFVTRRLDFTFERIMSE
jgi:hypothetical protein